MEVRDQIVGQCEAVLLERQGPRLQSSERQRSRQVVPAVAGECPLDQPADGCGERRGIDPPLAVGQLGRDGCQLAGKLLETEQIGRVRQLRVRHQACDLPGARLGRQGRPVGVRAGDNVRVGRLGDHEVGGRLGRAVGRREVRIGIGVAPPVGDRRGPRDVAVLVGLQDEFVHDARIVEVGPADRVDGPLVVGGQRLARMDEEHRVAAADRRLQHFDGVVVLGDEVRSLLRGRFVLRVHLAAQQAALQRAARLAILLCGQP